MTQQCLACIAKTDRTVSYLRGVKEAPHKSDASALKSENQFLIVLCLVYR